MIIDLIMDVLEWLCGVIKVVLVAVGVFVGVLAVLLCAMLGFGALCEYANGPEAVEEMEIVYTDPCYTIYRDKETNVMYFGRHEGVTIMVNEDGTPKIYKEAIE